MTIKQAIALLNLRPGASPEVLGKVYAEQRTGLTMQLVTARSLEDKASLQQKLDCLDEAFQVLNQAFSDPIQMLLNAEEGNSPAKAPARPEPKSAPVTKPVPVPVSSATTRETHASRILSTVDTKPLQSLQEVDSLLKIKIITLIGLAVVMIGVFMLLRGSKSSPETAASPPPPAAPLPPPPALPSLPAPPADPALLAASRTSPFRNSLDMEFVPAGTPGVLFSVWETRNMDYMAFARENGVDISKNKNFILPERWSNPVSGLPYFQVELFCEWLSQKEGRTYRLPTSEEWSRAVGSTIYPWGDDWPPVGAYGTPESRAAFREEDQKPKGLGQLFFSSWDYPYEALGIQPAGSHAPNPYGLYDMGGNVAEMCGSIYFYDDRDGYAPRGVRGHTAWMYGDPMQVKPDTLYSSRETGLSGGEQDVGFRCVLETTPTAKPVGRWKDVLKLLSQTLDATSKTNRFNGSPADAIFAESSGHQKLSQNITLEEGGNKRLIFCSPDPQAEFNIRIEDREGKPTAIAYSSRGRNPVSIYFPNEASSYTQLKLIFSVKSAHQTTRWAFMPGYHSSALRHEAPHQVAQQSAPSILTAHEWALQASQPFVDQGYILRDDSWIGTVRSGKSMIITQDLFKGNEYAFWLGCPAPDAQLVMRVENSQGTALPSQLKISQNHASLSFTPTSTGPHKIHFTITTTPGETLDGAVAYGYR